MVPIYYKDKDLLVTGDEIHLMGRVYPVTDVQSVKVWQGPAGKGQELPYYAITGGTLLLFFFVNLPNLLPGSLFDILPAVYVLDLLFIIGIVGVLLMQVFLRGKRVYMLGLRGTFGSSISICCGDGSHAQRMADAIRMAIVNHGQANAAAPQHEATPSTFSTFQLQ